MFLTPNILKEEKVSSHFFLTYFLSSFRRKFIVVVFGLANSLYTNNFFQFKFWGKKQASNIFWRIFFGRFFSPVFHLFSSIYFHHRVIFLPNSTFNPLTPWDPFPIPIALIPQPTSPFRASNRGCKPLGRMSSIIASAEKCPREKSIYLFSGGLAQI